MDSEGELLGKYSRNGTEANLLAQINELALPFSGTYKDHIVSKLPIVYENEILGELHVVASTHELMQRIGQVLTLSLIVLILSAIVIRITTKWLSRPLIVAINSLSHTFHQIASKKNYQTTANLSKFSEFNQMITSFNSMIKEIAERDSIIVQNQERLTLALVGSGQGLWDWDIVDGSVFCDKQLNKILEFPENELSKTPSDWLKRIHHQDRSKLKKLMVRNLSGSSEFVECELRILNKNKNWIWITLFGKVAQRDSQNKALRMTGVIFDSSQKHFANEENKLLSDIFKNTQEPAFVFNNNFHIYSANNVFCSLLKLTSEELKKMPVFEFFEEFYDKKFRSEFIDQLKLQGQWEGEVIHKNCAISGQRSWLRINNVGTQYRDNDRYLATVSDITERKKVEDELRYLANFDELTSLPNRRLCTERLSHAISIAKRYQQQTAVLFIDIDRFKKINDSLGHSVGDKFLIEVARRLNTIVRQSDTVARIGGDEFVLILENIPNRLKVAVIAKKLIEQLSLTYYIENFELKSSASLGICFYPQDGETPSELMKNADSAMYETKSSGRNGWLFYDKTMNERAIDRIYLENSLHKALENNEFYLVFQPKVSYLTDLPVGAEALVRWQHPIKGLIRPDQFIYLAEETGLIVPIGDWIINEACKQLSLWHSRFGDSLSIAINISPRQFQSGHLEKVVESALKIHKLSPQSVELELTESMLMESKGDSIEELQALKSIGVSLSIDDFGTGYSSLQYLSKFPIDYLKIDRSFVMTMEEDSKNLTIVKAIIAMAHGLNLKVVAEGVENKHHETLLKEFGCELGQGYFISEPLPEKEFIEFLENNLNQ